MVATCIGVNIFEIILSLLNLRFHSIFQKHNGLGSGWLWLFCFHFVSDEDLDSKSNIYLERHRKRAVESDTPQRGMKTPRYEESDNFWFGWTSSYP